MAVSNRTYTVRFADTLPTGPWTKLVGVVARATNRVQRLIDTSAGAKRFYRLATARQP
jgi:hypothetical protein